MQGNGLAGCADFGVSVRNLDDRRVTSLVHFNPIVTRTIKSHGHVRSVDLERLPLTPLAHVNDRGAGRDVDLRRAVIEIQERETGAAAQPDNGGADIHLRTRALVRPELVAGRERSV